MTAFQPPRTLAVTSTVKHPAHPHENPVHTRRTGTVSNRLRRGSLSPGTYRRDQAGVGSGPHRQSPGPVRRDKSGPTVSPARFARTDIDHARFGGAHPVLTGTGRNTGPLARIATPTRLDQCAKHVNRRGKLVLHHVVPSPATCSPCREASAGNPQSTATTNPVNPCGPSPRSCPMGRVTLLLGTRSVGHGAGRSFGRRVGSTGAALAGESRAGWTLAIPPPCDQRDSVPAANRPTLAGPSSPSVAGRRFTIVIEGGRRTARGRGSCGPSRPMPMLRAGSTGAWSASIPRPAALISTRPAPPLVPRRFRVGAGARRVIVPMRRWDAREAGSRARSTLLERVGVARSGLSSRPASGGTRRR